MIFDSIYSDLVLCHSDLFLEASGYLLLFCPYRLVDELLRCINVALIVLPYYIYRLKCQDISHWNRRVTLLVQETRAIVWSISTETPVTAQSNWDWKVQMDQTTIKTLTRGLCCCVSSICRTTIVTSALISVRIGGVVPLQPQMMSALTQAIWLCEPGAFRQPQLTAWWTHN